MTEASWIDTALEVARREGKYEFSLGIQRSLVEEMASLRSEMERYAHPTEFVRTAIRAYLDVIKKDKWRHQRVSVNDR